MKGVLCRVFTFTFFTIYFKLYKFGLFMVGVFKRLLNKGQINIIDIWVISAILEKQTNWQIKTK